MAVQTHESTAGIHRFTLDQYHAIAESRIGEELRVELIDGLVLDKVTRSPEHENVIAWLNEWLSQRIDWGFVQLRIQSAVTIEAALSEPEPDVMVIPRDASRPYHFATAALVIEVAMSSKDRDLKVKPRLYALAGVPDYWVVLLERRRVIVHRQPVDQRYESIVEVGPGGALEAVGVELPPLPVAELLAAANA
jgi:Uma2 family endonuclease